MHQKTEDGEAICAQISKDIEALKPDFPQLKDFKASQASNNSEINYSYHLDKPDSSIPGWRGGVPQPAPDGIWIRIVFWDENDSVAAMSQLNSQIGDPPRRIGPYRVTFVVMDGSDNKPLYGPIYEILQKHGLKDVEFKELH